MCLKYLNSCGYIIIYTGSRAKRRGYYCVDACTAAPPPLARCKQAGGCRPNGSLDRYDRVLVLVFASSYDQALEYPSLIFLSAARWPRADEGEVLMMPVVVIHQFSSPAFVYYTGQKMIVVDIIWETGKIRCRADSSIYLSGWLCTYARTL